MRHSSKVVIGQATIPIRAGRLEGLRLRRFLDRVRMLENLRARRLDANGVGDRELVQYGGDCLQQSRGKEPFVFRGQRRNKPNVHTTPTRSLNGG